GSTDWMQLHGAVETDFLACGTDSPMIQLASVGAAWPDSLVLMGTSGDTIWVPERDSEPDLSRISFAVGLYTYHAAAIRYGIVPHHVPLIGAVNVDEIREITRSAAMQPWSIRPTYDRPVARRIVEEAGIPRDAFATRKQAAFVAEARILQARHPAD